ncbi:MAG: hypothetical protein M1839_000606 [Geoglossum umbratile]|nr:MAG: hypothetical protein M1839_000606 [Geoglossum umbratile]
MNSLNTTPSAAALVEFGTTLLKLMSALPLEKNSPSNGEPSAGQDSNTGSPEVSANQGSVLSEVPNIPAHFSASQRQLYAMHYRMRSLDAAFKQHVARLNLTTAAELKPWVRVRDDIRSKIQELGERAARHAMEVEEAQSKQEIGTQEVQGKADEGLGDNAGSEPLPSEQVKATSQTENMFNNILKQRSVLGVSGANATNFSAPTESASKASATVTNSTPTLTEQAKATSQTENSFDNALEQRPISGVSGTNAPRFPPPTEPASTAGGTVADLAPVLTGQTNATFQTENPFSHILKQRPVLEAKGVSGANAFRFPAPAESANTGSSSLQSNTFKTGALAPSVLKPPSFGTPTNFMNQFAKRAEETAKKEKAKRKAEEFDSEEEDEDEWERRDEKAQLAKKQRLEAENEVGAIVYIPGKGFSLPPKTAKRRGSDSEEEDENGGERRGEEAQLAKKQRLEADNEAGAMVYTPGIGFSLPPKTAKRKAEGLDLEEKDGEEGERRGEEAQLAKKQRLEADNEAGATVYTPGIGLSLPPKTAKPLGVFGTATPPANIGKGLFDRISVGKDGKPVRVLPTDGEKSAKSSPASGTNAFGFSTGPSSNAEESSSTKSSPASGTNAFGFNIAPPPNTEDSSSAKSSLASGTNAFGFSIAQPPNVEESSSAKSSPASGTNAFGFNIAPPSSAEESSSAKSATSSPASGTNAFGFNIAPSPNAEGSSAKPSPASGNNAFGFNTLSSSKAEESSSASHAPIFGGINPFGFTVNPSSGEGTANRTSVFGSTNPFEFKVDPPKPSANHLPKFGESKSFNAFEFNFNPTTNGGMSTKSSSTSYVFGGGGSTDPAKPGSIFFSSSVLPGVKPAPKSVLSLSVPPTAASSNTSRATTPGATTDAGDSASESTAESGLIAGGDTPVGEDDSGYQYAGESDEDVLFQVKARAYEYVKTTGTYEKHGAGRFRILKHRVTGRTRMVHRTAPQWNVFINAALLPAMKYETKADNSVSVITASEDGNLTRWKMKVLRKEDAVQLARVLNENTPSG